MKRIAIDFGLKMFAGLTGLFLIVHFLGFSDNYNLRILNGFIHMAIIYFAVNRYRRVFPESYNNYISGVAVGMYTSMIGVGLFTGFMSIFLTFIDPAFFALIKDKVPFGENMNQLTASLFIFSEGIVVSLIGSYIVTRVIDARLEKKYNQSSN